MADSKITALTSIGASTDPANDPLVLVDVSDTSMAATGTPKKVTLNQLLGASGTATLASATITGDLTVDSSTLKVDSANNRVGIGTASPANPFDVVSASATIAVFKRTGSNGAFIGIQDASGSLSYLGSTNGTFAIQTPGSGYSDKYTIASDGTAIWSVGGSTAMTLNSTGLGVGRTPLTTLDAYGANKTNTNENGILTVSSSDSYAIDKGGSIAFFGKYNSSSGNACFARIYGAKENSTDGSFTGYFAVSTSPGGTPIERLRIDSSGNVGVGASPVGRLNIANTGADVVTSMTAVGVQRWQFIVNNSTAAFSIYDQTNTRTAVSIDSLGNIVSNITGTAPSLGSNGQLVVNATSNTNLRFSYRGSDGVTRVANLTLA